MESLKGAKKSSSSSSEQWGSSMLQVLRSAWVSISTWPKLPYSPLMRQQGWSSVGSQQANSARKYLEQAWARHYLSIWARSMFMEANLALVGRSRQSCLPLWNSILPTTSRTRREAIPTTLHSTFSRCSPTTVKYTSSSCTARLVFRPSTTSAPSSSEDWMLQYHLTVSENWTMPLKQSFSLLARDSSMRARSKQSSQRRRGSLMDIWLVLVSCMPSKACLNSEDLDRWFLSCRSVSASTSLSSFISFSNCSYFSSAFCSCPSSSAASAEELSSERSPSYAFSLDSSLASFFSPFLWSCLCLGLGLVSTSSSEPLRCLILGGGLGGLMILAVRSWVVSVWSSVSWGWRSSARVQRMLKRSSSLRAEACSLRQSEQWSGSLIDLSYYVKEHETIRSLPSQPSLSACRVRRWESLV